MPLYEMFCSCCGKTTEVLQRDPLETRFCPTDGTQLEVVPSVPARLTPGAGGKAGGYGKEYRLARSSEPK
jgi:hypothetical protein